MSTEELDVSEISLKWKVDARTRNQSSLSLCSSEFQFNGAGWKLNFYCIPTYLREYRLRLVKCSSGAVVPPFHASVRVERAGTERIESVLSQMTHVLKQYTAKGSCRHIWEKEEDEVLRAVPEFRRCAVLKLLVFLKVEGDPTPADFDAIRPPPIELSVPKATGECSSTKSTSVQTTLLTNAISCLESLSQDLAQLMVEGSHHDVEFQSAGQSTKVHKSIVCKRSPVIASMLSSDMVEGRTGVVNIPDMEPDIFTQFMRYIYSGQLEELTFDAALRLYEAGDQYAVHSLARRCSEFLVEHLSVGNAYEVLVVADAHSNENVLEKVVDYMVDNRVPFVSEGWSAFCDEHPKLANKVLNRGWKVLVK